MFYRNLDAYFIITPFVRNYGHDTMSNCGNMQKGHKQSSTISGFTVAHLSLIQREIHFRDCITCLVES